MENGWHRAVVGREQGSGREEGHAVPLGFRRRKRKTLRPGIVFISRERNHVGGGGGGSGMVASGTEVLSAKKGSPPANAEDARPHIASLPPTDLAWGSESAPTRGRGSRSRTRTRMRMRNEKEEPRAPGCPSSSAS